MIRMLRDIRDGLISKPGRLLLSLLAIVLGVFVLAVLLSVVGGIQQRAGQLVQELGVNVVAISPAQEGVLLEAEQVAQLRVAFPEATISGVMHYSVTTRDGKTRLSVLASDAALLEVRPWTMVDGRALDPVDIREAANHCLISRQLSERMGWRVGQPLGVKDQYFDIVGVIDTGGTEADGPLREAGLQPGENLVVIPETVPPYWEEARDKPGRGYDVVYLKLPASTSASDAVRTCEAVLQQPADSEHRFSYITPESLVVRLRHLQKMVQLAAGSLAVLCMILGGTTLASLMVANVQERMREIGLRLALGASEWSIGALFLVEAVLLTCLAGMLGTVIAHSLLWVYQARLPVPVKLSSYTLLAPVGYAMLFGALCAWWPARRAARVRPADALRNE